MSKELVEGKTLADILKNLEHEVPNIRILTYQRRDWSKRASLLSSSVDENHVDPSKEQNLHNWKKLRSASVDQIAVIELLMPSIFRAVVSLHPAGSVNPDAVAFFSPNEVPAILDWFSDCQILFSIIAFETVICCLLRCSISSIFLNILMSLAFRLPL